MTEAIRIEVVIRVEGAQAVAARPQAPEPLPEPKAPESARPISWLSLLPQAKLHDLVREIVITNLSRNEGNRTHTAKMLGISLRGLRNMINEFEASGHEVPESKCVGFGCKPPWSQASSHSGATEAGEL